MSSALPLSLRSLLCALATLIVLRAIPALAQQRPGSIPIESLLHDGRIDIGGASGSVDISGWRMTVDPDGAPRFLRSYKLGSSDSTTPPAGSPADSSWDDSFEFSGTSAYIRAIAVHDGYLYVGGTFDEIGGIRAANIARWNLLTGKWSPLGDGLSSTVLVFAVDGDYLYAGGLFQASGGMELKRVGRWSLRDEAWSAIGGVDGIPDDLGTTRVNALLVTDSALYVGGRFLYVDGMPIDNLARRTKSSGKWEAIGAGINGSVYALAASGDEIYIGGGFTRIDTIDVGSLARWNSRTGQWNAMGGGVAGGYTYVRTLLVDDSVVYVGGNFREAGGLDINNIARWNRTSGAWASLGAGVGGGTDSNFYAVEHLLKHGVNLYALGFFINAGNDTALRLASWNVVDHTWSPVGGGLTFDPSVNHPELTMAGDNDYIYVAGDISAFGDRPYHGLARLAYDGGGWSRVSVHSALGTDGAVLAMTLFDLGGGSLYTGGAFQEVGGFSAQGLAIMEGTSWYTLRDGIPGMVHALLSAGGHSYAAGEFSSIDGEKIMNIAVKAGQPFSPGWSPMGDGLSGTVLAMTMYGNDLVAGGSFNRSGSTVVDHIARWHDSAWVPIGSGLEADVTGLAVFNGSLYAVGTFTLAGDVPVASIARWDGSRWQDVGGGLRGDHVSGLAIATGIGGLYVGGNFDSAGSVAARNIALWDGKGWHALGDGVDGKVDALASRGSDLYVGGSFATAGNAPASNIARWNERDKGWFPLGSGTNNEVDALAFSGEYLYVGGAFTIAGGKASSHIGRWLIPAASVPFTLPPAAGTMLGSGVPNPFQHVTSIPFNLPSRRHVVLTICSSIGTEIATLVDDDLDAGPHAASWNADGLPSGVYFCRLSAGGDRAVTRLVVAR